MNDDKSAVMDEDDPHARAKANDDPAEQGAANPTGDRDDPKQQTRLRLEEDRQSER